jgi:hypothetical protein
MGYGNRDKPIHKSGRVGFVEGRLNAPLHIFLIYGGAIRTSASD